MSTLVLSLPGEPGVCVEQDCEAEANDTVYVDDATFSRLCEAHAEQWRAIDRSLRRRAFPLRDGLEAADRSQP